MRPLLVPENKELVHHIGLYECIVPPELGGTDAIFREHLQHPGERCFTASMPPEWAKYCHTFLITWAAGSEGGFHNFIIHFIMHSFSYLTHP